MQGLAQSMAQPQGQQQVQQPQQSGAGLPSVDEVVQLLMQGIDPAELEAQGIPPELIIQAIQIIEQQMEAEAQASPQQDPMSGGLASQMLG